MIPSTLESLRDKPRSMKIENSQNHKSYIKLKRKFGMEQKYKNTMYFTSTYQEFIYTQSVHSDVIHSCQHFQH